jgi:outer membrane protein insertion porin family
MEKSVRLGVFFDIGQVWAMGGTSNGVPGIDDGLRYSTGLSAAWISPVGPLKVSYGYAINKQPTDKTEAFQFQLGSTF